MNDNYNDNNYDSFYSGFNNSYTNNTVNVVNPPVNNNNDYHDKQVKRHKIFRKLFMLMIFIVIFIVVVLLLAKFKIIKLPWLDYPEVLNLSQNEVMLKKDTNYQFSTYVYPSQVNYGKIIFESSDPTVADINPITGYVETKQNGVATIKAYLEDYKDIYDTCDLVVSNSNVLVENIEIPNENVDILVGGTYKLKYTYYPKNAGLHYFSYSSSDDSIVSVNNKGEVKAIAPGRAVINILEEVSGINIQQEFTVYEKGNLNADEKYVVSSIKLSTDSINLSVGGNYQVEATVLPEEVVQTISWSSLNKNVATVSSDGLITAVDYGNTQIIATAVDGTDKVINVLVEDNEIPIEKIEISSKNITLKQGERKRLNIKIEPSNATDQKIEWKSTNEDVVSIDSSGKVEALSIGEAVIVASTSNGISTSCKINVVKQEISIPITDISLSRESVTINEGSSVNINVNITPSNATNKTIKWSSSNSKIATVSKGMIYGKSAGTAIITATTSNNISRQIQVIVKPIAIESITLNENSIKLGIGGEYKLYVTFKPSNASNKHITWISSNSSIATVDNNGIVEAKSLGETTVMAKTSNGKIVTCKIKVTNESIPVSKINLSSSKYIVKVNEKISITPIISPSNATNQKIKLKVNNTEIASVQSDGTIKGIKEGIVLVTATSNNGKVAKAYLIVKNKNSSINYLDGNTIKYWYDNTYGTYAITHIWVKNAYSQFKLEMPDKFGTLANASKLTQKAAKKNSGKTLISINASGFVTENFSKALYKTNKAWKNTSVSPIVIYEGSLIRDYTTIDLPHTTVRIYGMNSKGNLTYYTYSKNKDENVGKAERILSDGVKYTFGWYPLLVYDGKVRDNLSKDNNIRQGLCQIDANNFLYITNISSNRSKGFSHYSLANKMKELGCKVGFNLDGGGSTSIYYVKKGSSTPTKIKVLEGSYGRSIPDIVYFVGD